MSDRPGDLPDFSAPPVVEVVLSIQFERLAAFRTPQIGLLWAEVRDRFPKFEEHPPLDPVFEKFEPGAPVKIGLQIETCDVPPLPRIWFLNEDGSHLLQVQPDRLIHNWREAGLGYAYPRYERLRKAFAEEIRLFENFIERERLGELVVNQCELTYVNHIEPGEAWQRHGELSEIFQNWSELRNRSFLPEPEDVGVNARYVMRTLQGVPFGRLHAKMQAAWRISDKRPIYVLNLTARGLPQDSGAEGALTFLDTAREWIVKGFADLTKPRMHRTWGRIDG